MVSPNAATPIFTDSPPAPRGPGSRIYVIFTDAARTKTALLAAAGLARGLDLCIELLTAQVVPYPLPLNEPPVSIDFIGRAMSRLVVGLDTEVSVRILLCREADETLRKAVGPDALVVIGGGRSKLTRLLSSDRRRIIVID